MVNDPRVTAIIDAQNNARQVLLGAANDVLGYQNTVNGAAGSIARQSNAMQRTTETAYRVISRRIGGVTEVIHEQVQTVTEQLVPAYNDVIDAQYRMADANAAVTKGGNDVNAQLDQRRSILEDISRLTLSGKATDAGVATVTQNPKEGHAAGTVASVGAVVFWYKELKKGVVATRVEYGRLIAAGNDVASATKGAIGQGVITVWSSLKHEVEVVKDTVTGTIQPTTFFGVVMKGLVTIVRSVITVLNAAAKGFVEAKLAGAGMFRALIAGVREFTVALLESPLAPFILAILALVIAVKAAIAIFKFWAPELNKKAAADKYAEVYQIAYTRAVKAHLSAQQADTYAMQQASIARDDFLAKSGKMTALKYLAAKAFAPWIEWWKKFKHDFLQELAPTIAIITALFTVLGAAIMFVANKIVLPVVKLLSEGFIAYMKAFNAVLLLTVNVIIDVLQPVVDALVMVANYYKLSFGIILSTHLSMVEKFQLLGKLMVAGVFETIKAIINLFFGLVKGVAEIITFFANLLLFAWNNIFRLSKKIWKAIFDTIIDIVGELAKGIATLMEKGFNAVIDISNKAIEAINKILPKAAQLKEIGHVDFDSNIAKTIQQAHDALSKFIGDTSMIKSIKDLISQGLGLDFTKTANSIDATKSKILAFIKEFQDKYGVSFEAIAKQAGIDLWKSPDLAAAFKKVLEKTKLKLDGLDDLNDKLSDVNSKDVKVEINPLIQLIISENVDADKAREIILPIIDQAFKDGAANIASQVYKANL